MRRPPVWASARTISAFSNCFVISSMIWRSPRLSALSASRSSAAIQLSDGIFASPSRISGGRSATSTLLPGAITVRK